MKPLQLRMAGFAAYAQSQELSFDDVGLFAITGPTGSGKSTLLDAISFALYKQTPRMGAKGLTELIHPQNEMAKVELTFEVGPQLWRVSRAISRKGASQHRLENHQDGEWRVHKASEKVAELDAYVARLLGMDFKTFTRAILLPQGQFDLFLRGEPKERRETLIALYGLENLKAMKEQVGLHLNQVLSELAGLEGQLNLLEELTVQDPDQLRQTLDQLTLEQQRLGQEVGQYERELSQAKKHLEWFEQQQRLQRQLQAWEADLPRAQQRLLRLQQSERAQQLAEQLQALEHARQQVQAAQQQQAQAQTAQALMQQQLEQLSLQHLPEAVRNWRLLLSSAPVWQEQEKTLLHYGGNLHLKHPQPRAFNALQLDELHQAEAALKLWQSQHAQMQQLQQQHQSHLAAWQHNQEEVKRLQEQSREELGAIEALAAQHQQALAALHQAEQLAGVEAHHALLKQGEPCPLCGQTVHAIPALQSPNISPLRNQEQTLLKQLQQSQANQQKRSGHLEALVKQQPKLQQQTEQSRLAYEQAQSQLGAAPQLSLSQIGEERLAMLAGLAEELHQATDGLGVARWQAALQQKLEQQERLGQKLDELKAQLQQAELNLKLADNTVIERQRALGPLENAMQNALLQAGFASAQQALEARLNPNEHQRLQQQQLAHEQEGLTVRGQLQELQTKLHGISLVTQADVAMQQQYLEQIRHSQNQVAVNLVTTQQALQQLQDNLAKRNGLRGQVAKLREQHSQWHQLSQDLAGHKFQDFLLNRYQAGLLLRASELLHTLSHGRYSFHIQDAEYHVGDRWTETMRPIRTLSGGESFMASLSLALSLSEHLSKGRIGALFLDEGFGTLDAETLEQVAGVLEALPTQGRLVGIVTHVEALAERMPARLRVEKSPAGSRATWAED